MKAESWEMIKVLLEDLGEPLDEFKATITNERRRKAEERKEVDLMKKSRRVKRKAEEDEKTEILQEKKRR